MLNLAGRLYERAIASLLDINICKREKDVLVRLKSTTGFAPGAFDKLPVVLMLGNGQEVPGVLHVVESDAPRGLWYAYTFHALRGDDYNTLRFRGVSGWFQFSNIMKVRFETEQPREMNNPFFKK